MTFPLSLGVHLQNQFNSEPFTIKINSGVTTFLGPNGSGKSQVLRYIKDNNSSLAAGKKIRLLASGRMSQLENFRFNSSGTTTYINFEAASFGGTHLQSYRHQSEGVIGDFHTLNLRTDIRIKVSERLSTLFRRNIHIDWENGELKIRFSLMNGQPYSVASEASGLIHLVTILTALYDNEVGVLLLDEPEISLHPQLQSFLFHEIKKVSGDPNEINKKIVVLATHSTEFIDILMPEDIKNIVFFESTNKLPIQINTDIPELQSRKVRELISRLGQAHKSAFFSSRPLLVEGPSDAVLCNFLNQKLDLFLEAAGSQLVPVIGKGELPAVIKLFRIIGKSPVVLTDLDTLADGVEFISIYNSHDGIQEFLSKHGGKNLHSLAREIYSDFVAILEKYYSELSPLLETHYYWINRSTGSSSDSAKKRAGMAIILNSADSVLNSISPNKELSTIKSRISFLLDALEIAGCFILRKGTIESYYSGSALAESGKPYAAVEETQHLSSLNIEEIKNSYEDIVRCLKYASSTEDINESKLISHYLLAFVTPILSDIDYFTTKEEIERSAKKFVGEISSIFEPSIIGDKENLILRIDLKSEILEIDNFPIDFPKGSNPIEIVRYKFHN